MENRINIREEALDTLIDMEKNRKMSHLAIGDALLRLKFAPKQDRAFFTLLCEGVTERRLYLDYVLDSFSKTKMKKCKPLIRNLLRLSAYQILFTHVRDAAACSEAVNLAKKRGFRNLSGFVNGVLRSLIRQKDALSLPDREEDPFGYLSVRYSVPVWIVRLLAEQYGKERTERMLASFLQTKPLTVRTCLSRTTPEALRGSLEESGVTVESGNCFPSAMQISGYNHLTKLTAFRKGWFVVQDESSMFPVEISGMKRGDRVLDLCAAPGGKTFHAADRVGEGGRVIARDLTEYKKDLLQENNDRMRYSQVEIEQWDARQFDARLESSMDVVLADLPCSGLGIMGRKNDIKYRLEEGQLAELVTLQREILSVAWRYVKPGGVLLYATCTLLERENGDVVRGFLDRNKDFTLEKFQLPEPLGRAENGMFTFWPQRHGTDGFFIAKLRRNT